MTVLAVRVEEARLGYKIMLRQLNYKQKTDNREAAEVVKGVAKRVIVVKSPDPKVFEEAIFIVREDYMKTAPE